MCLVIKWRRHWTRGRGFVVGAAFGVWSALLLQFMCVAGIAAMPVAWLVNSTGMRSDNPYWLPVVTVVNAGVYGAFAGGWLWRLKPSGVPS